MKKQKVQAVSEPKKKKHGFYASMVEQIRTNRTAFIVFCILRVIVIGVMVRCALQARWESLFIGFLALALFMIPPFIEKNFKVELPTALEILAFIFVFCAEILGEIECYYIKIPIWDTMLHTVNGFMFAAFGFCLVDILNKNKKFRFEMSPAFLALVAFCFSMTIGVLWEFFEFGADMLLHTDMQKDFYVNTISTVTLDPDSQNKAVILRDIVNTIIIQEDGSSTVLNGYLDIGLIDTMKDLIVNFVGAVVFSFIGFFYVKKRGQGKIARQFIPVFLDEGQVASGDAVQDGGNNGENG